MSRTRICDVCCEEMMLNEHSHPDHQDKCWDCTHAHFTEGPPGAPGCDCCGTAFGYCGQDRDWDDPCVQATAPNEHLCVDCLDSLIDGDGDFVQ